MNEAGVPGAGITSDAPERFAPGSDWNVPAPEITDTASGGFGGGGGGGAALGAAGLATMSGGGEQQQPFKWMPLMSSRGAAGPVQPFVPREEVAMLEAGERMRDRAAMGPVAPVRAGMQPPPPVRRR